jgi:DNA-binding protein YbaB
MPDDRAAALARLVEQGEAVLRDARAAAEVSSGPGVDDTESVTVSLDVQGRVAVVGVQTGWRRRLGADGLSQAVLQAVRDASMRRLRAWGEAYGDDGETASSHMARSTGVSAGLNQMLLDRQDFQRRLQAAANARMSDADRRAALTVLLGLAQAIERGVDEVSGNLRATLSATHTGRSPNGRVTVTMTGGGEVTGVRLDRSWLHEAHEINIGRQITAAFSAAYEVVAARGVNKLIADSPLGAAQRAMQDPLGLARRLRMTD